MSESKAKVQLDRVSSTLYSWLFYNDLMDSEYLVWDGEKRGDWRWEGIKTITISGCFGANVMTACVNAFSEEEKHGKKQGKAFWSAGNWWQHTLRRQPLQLAPFEHAPPQTTKSISSLLKYLKFLLVRRVKFSKHFYSRFLTLHLPIYIPI